MIQNKSDDAVSPVIGVMLMLVITVVIAAVITMFATGIVTDTEPAPTAILDVKIYDYYQALDDAGGPDFHISHVSGDEIDTKNIEIRLSWTYNGNSYYSTYSADSFASKVPGGIEGEGGWRKQPMYMKATGGEGPWHLDHYFGKFILTPGRKITASADMLPPDEELQPGTVNEKSQFMDAIFNNGEVLSTEKGVMEFLPKGTAVNVMILHTPSNKVIYDKVVHVE